MRGYKRQIVSEHAEQAFVSTRLLRDTGKSDEERRVSRSYIERERDRGNDAAKAGQRDRVADFLIGYHAAGEQVRLLSLPSMHWPFENDLVQRCPDRAFRFFGLERTWGVMELGRSYMPGGRSVEHAYPLPAGEIRRFVTNAYCGSHPQLAAHWLWIQAGDFFSLTPPEINGHFRAVYMRCSALWLDFSSHICADVRHALSGVGRFCARKPQVPFIVSVMAARDDYPSDAARVREVGRCLAAGGSHQFECLAAIRHVNNAIPMLTVYGLMVATIRHPSNDALILLHEEEIGGAQ